MTAREVFAGTAFPLDYLTTPSGLDDVWLGRKVVMRDRVAPSDRLFVAAYPYFNPGGVFIPTAYARQ